jgi:IclR family transcriptional regulator, pca regulon regulatory protein
MPRGALVIGSRTHCAQLRGIRTKPLRFSIMPRRSMSTPPAPLAPAAPDSDAHDGDDQRLGRDFVQSLERGLLVMRCFTPDLPDLSVTEVAERTNISRAAARRILFTLERLGYTGRNRAGLFHLEPAVLSLGYGYIAGQQLPQIARPYLQAIAEQLHGSSSVAVLDHFDVMFIARARSPSLVSTTVDVGSRLPAHVTALGRVLLADLPEEQIDVYLEGARIQQLTEFTRVDREQIRQAVFDARETRYSLVDQELAIGVRAIAVPILDAAGSVAASLNVSVADSRPTAQEVVDRCLPVLRRAAAQISAALGPA